MPTNVNTSRTDMLDRINSAEKHGGNSNATIPYNKYTMITKVTVRPNPFYTVLTLDVSCESNRSIIVRMFNEAGKIVKMFSWYLVKGTNVTSINELSNLQSGLFLLDIIDNEGAVLFSSRITKE
ncbi:hypothetical protein H7X65_02525 [Candidatus Parcubacteria bacterium]|nr:hypothetical protein [Candidatus Parcubacteria bacterium]